MALARDVNLNAVRIFAIAARHGNFQRAAEVLNISHGAISQRIKQLELDLGVALFERKARGVNLTPNGEKYRDAADKALSILATAGADLERNDNRVILHLGASFATKWLMPRMRRFASQFPELVIATEVHEELMPRNLGQSEIAIWPAKTPHNAPGNHVTSLTELQLIAVGSPDLGVPDCPMGFEAILSFPLLQDAHRRWERLISSTGYQAKNGLLNFDRSALALDAAINGHGIAIAPSYMIEGDLAAGRLIESWRNPESSGEYLFLSWAQQNSVSDPVNRTVNWILSEFGLPAES